MFKVLKYSEVKTIKQPFYAVGEINNILYCDLYRILGEPTKLFPSGDKKMQVEWFIEFNGKYYTIYDWKTPDKEFTFDGLTDWSIGGNSNPTELIELINSKK